MLKQNNFATSIMVTSQITSSDHLTKVPANFKSSNFQLYMQLYPHYNYN